MSAPVTNPDPTAPPAAPTNTKAVLSLVFAFLFWPAAIVLGHMARKEIRRTGESGRGYATAGLVLSYAGLAGFLLILSVSAAAASHAVATMPPASITYDPPTMTNLPVPASSGPLTTIPEGGPYEIGTGSDQVPPGTYRTTGPTGRNPMGCYWERNSDTSGNSDSIIANDLTKGAATVTIGSTDGAFKTSSCQPWTKIK